MPPSASGAAAKCVASTTSIHLLFTFPSLTRDQSGDTIRTLSTREPQGSAALTDHLVLRGPSSRKRSSHASHPGKTSEFTLPEIELHHPLNSISNGRYAGKPGSRQQFRSADGDRSAHLYRQSGRWIQPDSAGHRGPGWNSVWDHLQRRRFELHLWGRRLRYRVPGNALRREMDLFDHPRIRGYQWCRRRLLSR